MLKICGGSLRGRKLLSPPGQKVRPTQSRVKEAFFSIVARRLEEAVFGDFFAGSGAMGLEAVSRGAQSAILVEKNKPVAALIARNIEQLGIKSQVKLIVGATETRLWTLGKSGVRCDIIFLDPPYRYPELGELLAGCAQSSLLAPGGLLCLEHHSRQAPEIPPGLVVTSQKRYGDCTLLFLERCERAKSAPKLHS